MKAWFHRASNWDLGEAKEINTFEDILKLVEEEGKIIIRRNRKFQAKPYPNLEMWEIEEKQGCHSCELEILVYDDYLE